MSDQTEINPLQQIAADAFQHVPNMYANGFINGIGASDMYVVFQLNGQSSLVLNMTPALAKSLAHSLNEMIVTYETQTQQTIQAMS